MQSEAHQILKACAAAGVWIYAGITVCSMFEWYWPIVLGAALITLAGASNTAHWILTAPPINEPKF